MDYNVSELNPDVFSNLVGTLVSLRRPCLLLGSPGVGKTDVVKEWAKKNGYKVVTRMLAQITPGDLSIPYVDNKVLRFAPAGFLADLKEGEKTILFLDELTAAPPEVATQVYELLLEHRLGDLVLPEDTYIMAAGNTVDDRAAAYEINTATAGRLAIFKIICDPNQWLNWASNCSVETYKGSGQFGIIHPAVISFYKQRPDLLCQDDDFDIVKKGSPRSAQRLSEVMYATESMNTAQLFPLVSAWIGNENATQFVTDLEEFVKLPDIQQLFAAIEKDDKETVKRICPLTISGLYGLSYAVYAYVAAIKPNTKKEREKAALKNIMGMYIFSILRQIEDDLPRNEIATAARVMLLNASNTNDNNYLEEIVTSDVFKEKVLPDFKANPSLDTLVNQY